MVYKVTMEIKITNERISNLLSAGLDYCGYWATVTESDTRGGEYLSDTSFVDGGFVKFQAEGGDYSHKGEKTFTLDLASIKRGIKLMSKNHPHQWSLFMGENEDAITGDVFIQFCLFGEEVFG